MNCSEPVISKLKKMSIEEVHRSNKAIDAINNIQESLRTDINLNKWVSRFVMPEYSIRNSYKILIDDKGIDTSDLKVLTINKKGDYIIGRSRQSDLSIFDSSVSAIHCRITLDEAGVLSITDLDSKNGTKVNKKNLRPFDKTILKKNACIQLGRVTISVKSEQSIVHAESSYMPVVFNQKTKADISGMDLKIDLVVGKSDSGFTFYTNLDQLTMSALNFLSITWNFCKVEYLPVEYKVTLVGQYLNNIGKRISRNFQTNCDISIVKSSLTDPENASGVSIDYLCNGHCSNMVFAFETNVLNKIGQYLQRLNANESEDLKICIKSELQTSIKLIFKKSLITVQELKVLKPGDYLFLDATQRNDKTDYSFEFGKLLYGRHKSGFFNVDIGVQVLDAGNNLNVIVSGESKMNIMKKNQASRSIDQYCETRQINVNNADLVELNVGYSNISVSVQDLLSLKPGKIVLCNKPVSEPVQLSIKDKIVALGHLVVVDEMLAIEITERIEQ